MDRSVRTASYSNCSAKKSQGNGQFKLFLFCPTTW